MAILHVLNSARVAGIASLVLPALPHLGLPVEVVMLVERRLGAAGRQALEWAHKQGLVVHEVPVTRRVDPAAIHRLSSLLRQRRATIAHAHDVKASTFLLAAAKWGRIRAALVSTHHGIGGRPGSRNWLYERFYTHAILPSYDLVLAVSDADRRMLTRTLGERVALHRNGANARSVVPSERPTLRTHLRATWPLPDDARDSEALLIGVIGRLSPEKRHDRVLDAFAQMERALTQRTWLVVFGTGPSELELRQRARGLRIDERVVFAGYRPRVGDELAGLDLVLSLSDAEGLPINLIEAGWARTPVLATAVGGVPELLGTPPAGVLLKPDAPCGDIAIEASRLLRDQSLREHLGQRLAARVESQFSRDAWLSNLREHYSRLVR
jgi:glycosyltransferase involved in cell wall biosynthesis